MFMRGAFRRHHRVSAVKKYDQETADASAESEPSANIAAERYVRGGERRMSKVSLFYCTKIV